MRKGSGFGVQDGFFLNPDTLNPGFSDQVVHPPDCLPAPPGHGGTAGARAGRASHARRCGEPGARPRATGQKDRRDHPRLARRAMITAVDTSVMIASQPETNTLAAIRLNNELRFATLCGRGNV